LMETGVGGLMAGALGVAGRRLLLPLSGRHGLAPLRMGGLLGARTVVAHAHGGRCGRREQSKGWAVW
jgi:hypothetical protein